MCGCCGSSTYSNLYVLSHKLTIEAQNLKLESQQSRGNACRTRRRVSLAPALWELTRFPDCCTQYRMRSAGAKRHMGANSEGPRATRASVGDSIPCTRRNRSACGILEAARRYDPCNHRRMQSWAQGDAILQLPTMLTAIVISGTDNVCPQHFVSPSRARNSFDP